jgi:RNA polymerase sigma-70 factor (ECF subfamily)
MGYFSAITDDASASQRATASEAQLVASAQHGEPAAYAELCGRHRETVFRTVLKIIGNVDDAEDVLQDAWMRAFIHIKSFEGRASFATWMTRIAINFALGVLRKRRKRKEFSLDDSVDSDNPRLMQMKELSSNPEERCIEAERQRLVQQAIRRLPSKLRAAIEIRQSQDGSMHELAMVAGVPVPTMKSRLLRARLKLREPLRRALKEKGKGASPGGKKGSNLARGIPRHQVPVVTSGEAITQDPVGVVVSEEFAAIDTHSDEVRCVIGHQIALDAHCDTGSAI